MPGPARKPEALRKLQGYPDQKPPRPELKVKPSRPAQPNNLTAAGKKEWKRVIDAAMRYGICGDIDHAVFHMYIQEWQTCEELQRILDENGYVLVAREGDVKRNPADTAIVQHRARLQSLMNELGFTPAARTKVKGNTTEAPKPKDPFAVFDGGKL